VAEPVTDELSSVSMPTNDKTITPTANEDTTTAVQKDGDHQQSLNLNYAETLSQNMDGFEVVNRESRRNRGKQTVKRIVGNAMDHMSFAGVEKKSVVCVSRLERTTSAEKISDFL
jgi:hypothetical protein